MSVAGISRRNAVLEAGHVVVGLATVGLAVVLVIAGRSPGAGLGGVFFGVGLLVALAGIAFTIAAIVAAQKAHRGNGSLPIALSVLELVAGVVLAAALAVAVQGYGSFEPWRSPLLLPTVVLLALGLWGTLTAKAARRG